MRILLVEDEPRAAQMLAKGLREQAYAVDVVGDGKRAVYQAAITEYDAIVLDVVLPLQDGLAVCRAIRQEGSAVPVLMLTARDAVEARDCRVGQRSRRLSHQAVRFRRTPGAPPRHYSPWPTTPNTLDSSRRYSRTGYACPPCAPSRGTTDVDRAGVRAAGAPDPACQRGRKPRRHRGARVGRSI